MALLLAVTITINYALDFEDSYIDADHGKPIKWLWMFLFHALPFLVTALLLKSRTKTTWWKSGEFWIPFLIGFGFLAFQRSFYGLSTWLKVLPPSEYYFVLKCSSRAISLLILVSPLLIYNWFLGKDPTNYGLAWRRFSIAPYLYLLAIAAVFIFAGSFLGDLKAYYPRYAVSGAKFFLNSQPEISEKWLVAIYELCYASNFISVEFFFRGFLIYAFSRTLGPHAVLPMVVTYCFLHFGKPLGETISSIFGGYILGIISYYSRNVWGGIVVHIGVAWIMELAGWWQRLP